MTLKAKKSLKIVQKLKQVSWIVQEKKAINPNTGPSIAVREHQTNIGWLYQLCAVHRLLGCGHVSPDRRATPELRLLVTGLLPAVIFS